MNIDGTQVSEFCYSDIIVTVVDIIKDNILGVTVCCLITFLIIFYKSWLPNRLAAADLDNHPHSEHHQQQRQEPILHSNYPADSGQPHFFFFPKPTQRWVTSVFCFAYLTSEWLQLALSSSLSLTATHVFSTSFVTRYQRMSRQALPSTPCRLKTQT